MDPILYAAVLYSGVAYLFYQAWALRDFSRCPAAVFVTFIALAAWPFFVPMRLCLILSYIVALGFIPFLKKKGLLKKARIIWLYSILAAGALALLVLKILLLLH